MLRIEVLDSVSNLPISRMALVLFSGGFDSACVVLDLKRQGLPTTLLTFNFIDRPVREAKAARKFAQTVDAPLMEHELPVRDARSGAFGDLEPMYEGWMPHRNAIFFTVAANIAVAEGYGILAAGIRCTDAPAFPDSAPSFLSNLMQLMSVDGLPSEMHQLLLYLPLLRNHDLARKLLADTAARELLKNARSCWRNTVDPCGICIPCRFRSRFEAEVLETLPRD